MCSHFEVIEATRRRPLGQIVRAEFFFLNIHCLTLISSLSYESSANFQILVKISTTTSELSRSLGNICNWKQFFGLLATRSFTNYREFKSVFLPYTNFKLIKEKRCKNKCKVLPNNLWLQTSHNKSYNYDKLHIIISSVDSNSRNKCLKDLWENWEHSYTGVHESSFRK